MRAEGERVAGQLPDLVWRAKMSSALAELVSEVLALTEVVQQIAERCEALEANPPAPQPPLARDPRGGTGVSGYSLLLEFDRDGEDFRDGFEMGRMWTLAQSVEDEFTETVHVVNAEMLLRIGERTERSVSWEETQDGWAEVTFGEVSP